METREGREDKETKKRKRQRGIRASALGHELEGWIFFMKGFEKRAGRNPLSSACPYTMKKSQVRKLKPEFAKMKIRPSGPVARDFRVFVAVLFRTLASRLINEPRAIVIVIVICLS